MPNGETTPEVAAPLLPEATPPAAPAGATYSYTLPSIGTGTWSVAGGALPTGLTLNPTTGEISGVATVGGTFSFVALFVRDDGLEDYQTVTITVAGASAFADLAVTTVPSPSPGTAGSPMTYLTTVANAGPSAAGGVTLTQSLPLNVTALSVTPSQGSCTVTSFVQCNLGTIANGAFATVTLNLTPGASGFAQSDGDRGERDRRRGCREQRRDRLDPHPGICAVCDANLEGTDRRFLSRILHAATSFSWPRTSTATATSTRSCRTPTARTFP